MENENFENAGPKIDDKKEIFQALCDNTQEPHVPSHMQQQEQDNRRPESEYCR